MANIKNLSSIWNNIKEIDLKPIRDSALLGVKITIAGAVGAGKHTLAEQMRIDPKRPDMRTQSPITIVVPEIDGPLPMANLVIFMVDALQGDFTAEQTLVNKWSEAGKNVLVFVNKFDLVEGDLPPERGQGWVSSHVLFGSAKDSDYLVREFVPAVLEMLPQQQLALGRLFPLFRHELANQLINETCLSNAAYSFSTGLAEIVPVLDLPLNLTDLIVLTKSQAFLAYRLGLLLGFSTQWQDYVTEFGGVIGSGFIWRQVARSLVGLIPVWGIIPKVAIAYSGTYVVGHAILGWYLSGRHLNAKQMRALSAQAFARGREYANRLIQKMPKRHAITQKQAQLELASSIPAQLEVQPGSSPDEIVITKHRTIERVVDQPVSTGSTAPEISQPSQDNVNKDKKKVSIKLPAIKLSRQKKRPEDEETALQVCPRCGKSSAADAAFCQYCGMTFETGGMEKPGEG